MVRTLMKGPHKRSRLLIGLLVCFCSRSAIEGFSSQLVSHRRCESSLCAANDEHDEVSRGRRQALQGIVGAVAFLPTLPASAGLPEMDSFGQLYSPKGQMLSGGSAAARGIPVAGSRPSLQAGQAVQTIYETRFIAYLSRFLLNYDPAAHAWWVKQGFEDTWEQQLTSDADKVRAENVFAEFAESVEVGLADYFSGPFGSYSSLAAATAGLEATTPARSTQTAVPRSLFSRIFFKNGGREKVPEDRTASAKQGILNLYSLLMARYNSKAAKRQLAILFSFISSPDLQPVNEIRSLLGQADNATVSQITVTKSPISGPEWESRTSPRRGGGYRLGAFPTVTIESPPPLGDTYKVAKAKPIMKPTSRILSIRVLDGGQGYTTAPGVHLVGNGSRQCQACAILGRDGSVESVVVLDPGYGYGGRVPPKVRFDPPINKRGDTPRRTAKAVADLEYEIVEISLTQGGNGYVTTEPPRVTISSPPEDPDWFLNVQEQPEMRMVPMPESMTVTAQVAEMRFEDGNIAYSSNGMSSRVDQVDDDLLARLQRDSLDLLPSSVRPELGYGRRGRIYAIPGMANIPQFVAVMSPLYRACDPIFGGVGRLPVTKGAKELSASEYARLALSGALCTVAVRTLLNPLELVKTKQQLLNDHELLTFTQERLSKVGTAELSDKNVGINDTELRSMRTSDGDPAPSLPDESGGVAVAVLEKPEVEVAAAPSAKIKIGPVDLIQSIIQLRGPAALFQSADITFLASLVFGSFGFGATELFRRSFSSYFLQDGGSEGGSEIVLLLAASVATIVTAAAASPFEVLRVRSMGTIEAKKWTVVLEDFLAQNKRKEAKRTAETVPASVASIVTPPVSPETTLPTVHVQDPPPKEEFQLSSLGVRDLLPLWGGFAPTVSRELPFAVAKFLTFDLIARFMVDFLNSQSDDGYFLPIQVGVGFAGLSISAAAGALAGVAGAVVSHPADLILTKTSSSEDGDADWKDVVRELISQDGGLANLFVGLGARATFFFLVIGLQFFLYDYVKNLFQVGSDDLSLVLDVFYAVRAGLAGLTPTI